MKKVLFISALLFGIIFNACSSNEPYTYEMKKYEVKWGNCKEDSCITLIASYPFFSKKVPSSDSLNRFVLEFLSGALDEKKVNSLDELLKELIAMHKDTYGESPDNLPAIGMPTTWFYDYDISVLLAEDDLISIRAQISYYTGGAHPNSFTSLATYSVKEQKFLQFSDLFNKDKEKELFSLGEKYFKKEREIEPGKTLQEEGYWFEEFYLNNNFAMIKDSIKFYYNPYEVAAYVYGPTEITLPISEIKEFMKK